MGEGWFRWIHRTICGHVTCWEHERACMEVLCEIPYLSHLSARLVGSEYDWSHPCSQAGVCFNPIINTVASGYGWSHRTSVCAFERPAVFRCEWRMKWNQRVLARQEPIWMGTVDRYSSYSIPGCCLNNACGNKWSSQSWLGPFMFQLRNWIVEK